MPDDPDQAELRTRTFCLLILAAVAAGAHGIIVDVHPNPAVAKCDGAQALSFENFHNLAVQVEAVAQAISRVSTEVG